MIPHIDPPFINKIRKLMSLTVERGATEAEAALAADRVQRMLAERNLSMAAIEAAGGAAEKGSERTKENVSHRQVYKWQRTLMAAVAELNFCLAMERFEPRGRSAVFDGYDLIGRADNVATTRVMFEYLLQTIERLARADAGDPTRYFTRAAHSFKEGCADRLVERLDEQRRVIIEEQEQKAREDAARSKHPAAASSNLLVIALSNVIANEADLNNDFKNGWVPGTTTSRAAQARARSEQLARGRADRLAKRKADLIAAEPGINDELAQMIAEGYGRTFAEEYLGLRQPVPQKPETDAQRRKRQQKEDRWQQREYERRQREYARLDRAAYNKGQDAGDTVNLHRQVDGVTRNRIGGK